MASCARTAAARDKTRAAETGRGLRRPSCPRGLFTLTELGKLASPLKATGTASTACERGEERARERKTALS